MFLHLRLTPARAAFARPGPHATAFPNVSAPMQPSDSLAPLGRRSGRPSPAAYPGAQGLFFPVAPAPPPARATPETLLPRLPTRRLCPEERQGPPRCLGHPLRACRALRPRRVRCAPRPANGALAVAFRPSETLSTRNAFDFGALLPTAHALACLRFAQAVTVSGARLATGRAGSPLAGRVSHPLDDEQGFMVSSHTPILLDQPCLVAPKAGIHENRGGRGTSIQPESIEFRPKSSCKLVNRSRMPTPVRGRKDERRAVSGTRRRRGFAPAQANPSSMFASAR